ncbi:SDR family oxidoreductase [Pelagibacteraceae bacterium]|nr:SDR family oxidoreductase [Candidatus Pelagibacter sp.]MDC1485692.1 SDR family oxidoreductase [Pelagibacteraceae bacterium]
MDSLVNKKIKKFQNKVVVITGASSGLGLNIAKEFIKENAKVSLCARRIDKLKKNYQNKKNVFFQKVDVSNEKNIQKFLTNTVKKFGKIDVLINNAGIAKSSKIENIKYNDLKKTYEVNVFAPVIFLRESLKIMKKKNYGRIINISSGGSVNCAESFFLYSSSKSALNTLAKTFAKEIKKFNIKINTMSPGPCKTAMFPNNKLSTSLSIPTVKYLSSIPSNGPSGKFFWFMKKIDIIPDLSHIDWSNPKLKIK